MWLKSDFHIKSGGYILSKFYLPSHAWHEIQSPIRIFGGKSILATKIVKVLHPHEIYVEPFFGAGSVFWRKNPSKIEVINDIDSDLIRFMRYLKDEEFSCDMRPNIEKFREIVEKRKNNGDLSPCEFLYLNKHSYSGKIGKDISPSYDTFSKRCLSADDRACMVKNLVKYMDRYKERLKDIKIENKDFREIIREWDSPNTLFYLDPPYVKANKNKCHYYSCDVTPSDVARAVNGIKGKYIISYDDDKAVWDSFLGIPDVRIYKVKNRYTSNPRKRKLVEELIITNYEIRDSIS
ncbi:MAG: DNA adenine methylase [Candidatus Thermoplasmatota archaeon]|nr:DNA adenine methylase [Candidatus Thermoplasmatota archaeon]